MFFFDVGELAWVDFIISCIVTILFIGSFAPLAFKVEKSGSRLFTFKVFSFDPKSVPLS